MDDVCELVPTLGMLNDFTTGRGVDVICAFDLGFFNAIFDTASGIAVMAAAWAPVTYGCRWTCKFGFTFFR